MASIGSESPPRKKLKQARLPFQVISSPRTDGDKASGGIKRKLSESDDIQITKVVKSAVVEEIKENTIQEDLKTGMKAMLSTLLTSKIINNCTEPAEEDEISLPKGTTKEEIQPKSPEVQFTSLEDSNKKAKLSKNILDKLSSWKKSPSKTEPVTMKETEECTIEKTPEQSTPSETSKTSITVSEISSKLQCHTSSTETPNKKGVEISSREVNLSESAIVFGKPEVQNQDSNHSANSSVIEIDLEVDSDSKPGELNEDTPTASPQPPCNSKQGELNSSTPTASPKAAKQVELNEGTPTASPKALPYNSAASPRTPKAVSGLVKPRLTPKQVAKLKEAAKKQEEKDRIKMEKERKRQEEQEEKLRLKQEKEEQKRKEKEEKEEQKRKEKEEKEKKRQADIDLKNEEKRRKEEHKAEEKRKKESEKRKAEEEEERKKAKESAMFTSFFVAKTCKSAEKEKESPSSSPTVHNFMPFEVKSDMRVAPCTRGQLDSNRLHFLDQLLETKKDYPSSELYVAQLRSGVVQIGRTGRTWEREELKEEEISILEPVSEGVFVQQPELERMRAKFLQFHENHRPAYYGTWRKKSKTVSGRRPTAQDKILDYDVDSADEWEEEEPGESLHGSDDEKDKESEDEYEVDNSVFVPHGYLSDDEGDAEIDEDTLNPEMQKAKLKILGEEFETQMKTKTSVLKPIVILLTAAMQSAKLPGSLRYQKLADRRAVWREDEGPIDVCHRVDTNDAFGESPLAKRLDADGLTGSTRGPKPSNIVDEAIPALIALIHGAPYKGKFLVEEFHTFLKKQSEAEEKPSSEPSAGETVWPKFPVASKASIARKLKELAAYGHCNEEGPMKGKRCWLVPVEKREQYGVANLELPNTWKLILKRPRARKTSVAVASPSTTSGDPVHQADTPTPTAKKSLITNFTKVLTAEEKQQDWEKMKKSPPSKKAPTNFKGKITSFTSLFPSASSSSASPAAPKARQPPPKTELQQVSPAPVKKRVALLVSVPRGQDIPSAVTAATASDAATTPGAGTSNAVATPGSAVLGEVLKTEEPTAKARKEEPEIIELD